jgi:subtilisin family serine protease
MSARKRTSCRISSHRVPFEVLENRRLLSASVPGFVLAPLHPRTDSGAGPSSAPVRPGDTSYGSLWGMEKIQAPLAWDQTTGGTSITVADIDSGMDYTHEDLYLNVWLNQGEIPSQFTSGLQDTDRDGRITFYDLNAKDAGGSFVNASFVADGNHNAHIDAQDLLAPLSLDPVSGWNTGGWEDRIDNDINVSHGRTYIDDLIGWNFITNTNDPFDGGTANGGHGTHTAGTIAAMGNNGTGVTGVNWQGQIMPLKIFADSGTGAADTVIADAIYYSADNGAEVSNNSWGGTGGTTGDALYTAIQYAGTQKNQLYVAAAGNGDIFGRGINNDTSSARLYPASYDLPNIIAVAATDSSDNLASFSNYGAKSVDLGAPGVGILSTTPGNTYSSYNGTSMATPHVSGVAALVWGQVAPGASYSVMREAILKGVDAASALAGKTVTGGRLNANGALGQLVAPVAPAAVSATAVSSTRIDLAWTDSSDNENGFQIRRSDGANFQVGRNVTGFSDTGLTASTTYSYQVTAYNNAGVSAASAPATATTPAGSFLAAPTNLKASASSTRQINLTWSDNSNNEGGFKIERSTGSGASFTQIATVAANVNSYASTGLEPSTVYAYRVRAYSSTGDSSYTNTASEMTLGAGTGLTAEYYDNIDWTALKLTRTDAAINFDWGSGSPARTGKTKIGSDTFSVRWTGSILPRYSETYTLRTETDDGVGLWITVNGTKTPLWKPTWERTPDEGGLDNTSPYEATVTLQAGVNYAIEMKYYENYQGARAKLMWKSASQALQVIPQSQLFLPATGTTTAAVASGSRIGVFSGVQIRPASASGDAQPAKHRATDGIWDDAAA